MVSVKFFSIKRLKSYKNEQEHKRNFLLVQALAPKLGILEIVTRNLAFKALVDNDKVGTLSSFNSYFELDDLFVSKQTFGFWAKVIDEAKIHNDIVNLDKLDFKKYSNLTAKINF